MMAMNARKHDYFSPAWLHKDSSGADVPKNGWLDGSAGGSAGVPSVVNFQQPLVNGSATNYPTERRSTQFGRRNSDQDAFSSYNGYSSAHRSNRPPAGHRPPLVKSQSDDHEQYAHAPRGRVHDTHWGSRSSHSHIATTSLTEKSFNQHFPSLRGGGGPSHGEAPPPPGPAGVWDPNLRRTVHGRPVVGQVSRTRRQQSQESLVRSRDSSPTRNGGSAMTVSDQLSGSSEITAKKSIGLDLNSSGVWNGSGPATRPGKLTLGKTTPPATTPTDSPTNDKFSTLSYRSGKQAQSPGKITLRPLVKPEMRRSPPGGPKDDTGSSSSQSGGPAWSNQQAPPPAAVRAATPTSKERPPGFLKQGELRTKAATSVSRNDFFKSLRHSSSSEAVMVDVSRQERLMSTPPLLEHDESSQDVFTSDNVPRRMEGNFETVSAAPSATDKTNISASTKSLGQVQPVNGDSDDAETSIDPEELRILMAMGWHHTNNDDDELSKPITDIEIEEFMKKKQTCQVQNHRNLYNMWKISYRKPVVLQACAETDDSSDLSDSSDEDA